MGPLFVVAPQPGRERSAVPGPELRDERRAVVGHDSPGSRSCPHASAMNRATATKAAAGTDTCRWSTIGSTSSSWPWVGIARTGPLLRSSGAGRDGHCGARHRMGRHTWTLSGGAR